MFTKIIILTVSLLTACKNPNAKSMPRAVQGVLDLREWDFEKDGTVSLDGEWEFYWKEFCDPDPIHRKQVCLSPSEKTFITVPGTWNNFAVRQAHRPEEKPVGSDGLATYRIRVLLSKSNSSLAFKIKDQGTAYSMFVNGEKTASNGTVGKDKLTSIPRSLPLIESLQNPKEELEILIHISNFHYNRGGIWLPIELGNEKEIRKLRENNLFLDMFLAGSICIIGLYHFILYALRGKDKSPLLFGAYCFIIVLRLLSTGEKFFTHIFPEIPFQLLIKIEYLSFYLAIPLFTHFLYTIFPDEFKKTVLNLIWLISILFIIPVCLTSTGIFTHTVKAFQIFTIMSIIYFLSVVGLAVFRKREGSKTFFTGSMLLMIGAVNDILYSNRILASGNIIPHCLLGFIFFQSAMLSMRFSRSFNQAEILSAELVKKSHRLEETRLELEFLNKNLENRISERTKELEESNSEVEDLNRFTAIINSLSDLDNIFTEISKHFYNKFKIRAAWLLLPDKNKNFLYTYKMYSYERLPDFQYQSAMNVNFPVNKGGGIMNLVYHRKKPFYLSKIPELESEIDREMVEILKLKSILFIPLINKEECAGIVLLTNLSSEMKLSKKTVGKISSLCYQIAGVIQTAQLLEEINRAKKETEDLNKLIKSLNEELDLKVIMQKVHKYVRENFGIQNYALYSRISDSDFLELIDVQFPDFVSEKDAQKIKEFKIQINSKIGAHGFAFRTRKSIFIADTKNERVFHSANKEEQFVIEICKFKSMLLIPLILNSQVIGILDLSNSEEELLLEKEDIDRLSIVAEQLTGIIHGSNLFKQVQEEKQKVEQQKNEIEKLAESRKRLSTVGQMVAGIVHDIKNPIAGIKGLAERLNSNTIKPEKRERNAKMIVQELDRLSDMVYEILDFSKGKITLEISTVNLSNYILEILQFQQTNLDYYSIKAVTDLKYDGEIEIDISRMRRVIGNLIQNSVEAMYDGKKEYYVKLSTREEGDFCVIDVEDNGPGLPASFEEKIFEAFATEGKAKGTGLGLFMSKGIVESHGGNLSYATGIGTGTTFFIKIPKVQKERGSENEENTYS